MGRPLGSILEIKPFSKEMESGGFVISTDNAHTPEKGEVLSIGDEVEDVKVGDSVIFRKGAYSKVSVNGKDVLLVEEKSVYYIL